MVLYQVDKYPLRIYIEDDNEKSLTRLRISLDNKYGREDTVYQRNQDDIESLIQYDTDGNPYIIYGLKSIILSEADNLLIPYKDRTVSIERDDVDDNNIRQEITEEYLEGITLRPYQIDGIITSLMKRRGLVQVATGGGKTEMMSGVVKYILQNRKGNILICVPSTNLLYQTYERFINRGIPDQDISMLGDSNNIDISKRICISTVASAFRGLDNNEDYTQWIKSVDCLLMDEAHHGRCRTWSTVIDRLAPEYILGFSAEPFNKDKDHQISDLMLRGLFGPIIYRVTIGYLVSKGYLSKPYVLALNSKSSKDIFKQINWGVVNKLGIVGNSLRNELIVDAAIELINIGKKPLILVQQIIHGEFLAEQISRKNYNVYMMIGGRKISVFIEGKCINEYIDTDNTVLSDFNKGKMDVLIGTSTLDEGIDVPKLESVILAGGGKSSIKLVQRVGRSLRQKEGLNTSFIIDFQDNFNLVTRSHFKKRVALYKESDIDIYYVADISQLLPNISYLESKRSNELKLLSNN